MRGDAGKPCGKVRLRSPVGLNQSVRFCRTIQVNQADETLLKDLSTNNVDLRRNEKIRVGNIGLRLISINGQFVRILK